MKSGKNIILIGFMGSGKTKTAQILGTRLKRDVFSTDQVIVDRARKSIADIFQDDGEAAFRKAEEKVVKELSQMSNIIIDCGGGVVVNPLNLIRLKNSGSVFYLKAGVEFLYEMVKHDRSRPLLQVPDPLGTIKSMLNEREEFYNQADVIIQSENRTIEEIAREIETKIESN